MRNKVTKDNVFEYEEVVKEFTGLVFHCPKCDEIFHLHIASVKPEVKSKKEQKVWKNQLNLLFK